MVNDQGPATNLISVRGVSDERRERNQAPSICLYLSTNLHYKDANCSPFVRPYDLARVETVKGPQEPVRRSASGGVNQYITHSGKRMARSGQFGFGNGQASDGRYRQLMRRLMNGLAFRLPVFDSAPRWLYLQ